MMILSVYLLPNDQRRDNFGEADPSRRILLYNLESGALTMARSRAVQHRANGVNGLAVAADNAADIALAQLHFENRQFAARNFRQEHVVRKLDQLANDELQKFFHAKQHLIMNTHE